MDPYYIFKNNWDNCQCLGTTNPCRVQPTALLQQLYKLFWSKACSGCMLHLQKHLGQSSMYRDNQSLLCALKCVAIYQETTLSDIYCSWSEAWSATLQFNRQMNFAWNCTHHTFLMKCGAKSPGEKKWVRKIWQERQRGECQWGAYDQHHKGRGEVSFLYCTPSPPYSYRILQTRSTYWPLNIWKGGKGSACLLVSPPQSFLSQCTICTHTCVNSRQL